LARNLLGRRSLGSRGKKGGGNPNGWRKKTTPEVGRKEKYKEREQTRAIAVLLAHQNREGKNRAVQPHESDQFKKKVSGPKWVLERVQR